MTAKAIADAVAAGFLEPCSILDAEGHEVRGYRLTDSAAKRFGQKPAADDPLALPEFLRRADSIQCMRCRVEVPADQLNNPKRCTDKACPLNRKQESA